MYLAPQHLQLTDRCTDAALSFWMHCSPLPSHGFLDIDIDADAVANGLFRLMTARGILPDGAIFSAPESDDLPPSRSIAEHFDLAEEGIDVFLALPSDTGTTRAGGAGQYHRLFDSPTSRYVTRVQTVPDELAGADEKPVAVAARNLRFAFSGESLDADVILRCARVLRSPAGIYVLDPAFAAPCLQIRASSFLIALLRAVVESLVAARSALLRKPQPAPGFELFQRNAVVRDLNVAITGLTHIFRSGREHPEYAYRALACAAASLSGASPDFDPSSIPPYDHNNSGPAFRAMYELLRQWTANFAA
jgi:type VI secretion system protein ImpJ